MALITVDENNYIISYLGGPGVQTDSSIEVELPFDEDELLSNFGAYKYENGQFIKDEAKLQAMEQVAILSELRNQRATLCFPVINRGRLWYDNLTEDQVEELSAWYQAWLDVTETLTVPATPNWVD